MRKINTFNVDEDVYNTLSDIFTKAIECGKEKKAPHLHAMVIFDLYTGLRKEEVKKLEGRMDNLYGHLVKILYGGSP